MRRVKAYPQLLREHVVYEPRDVLLHSEVKGARLRLNFVRLDEDGYESAIRRCQRVKIENRRFCPVKVVEFELGLELCWDRLNTIGRVRAQLLESKQLQMESD